MTTNSSYTTQNDLLLKNLLVFYNTNENDLNYFFGSKSHNTVTLGKNDQMLKGGRFIWYYWTQTLGAELIETEDKFTFNGLISAFRQIDKKAVHKRKINKKKGIPVWEISDELIHDTNLPLVQYWHPSKSFFDKFEGNYIHRNNKRNSPASSVLEIYTPAQKQLAQLLK